MVHQEEQVHQKEHSHESEHSHHESTHHEVAHHSEHGHHDDHHGHWEPPKFSQQERILHHHPKSIQNSCTDHLIAYEMCTRKISYGSWPFGWLFKLHWANRWSCENEYVGLSHCEDERSIEYFEKNIETIRALQGAK